MCKGARSRLLERFQKEIAQVPEFADTRVASKLKRVLSKIPPKGSKLEVGEDGPKRIQEYKETIHLSSVEFPLCLDYFSPLKTWFQVQPFVVFSPFIRDIP